jgi:hypothetical protein
MPAETQLPIRPGNHMHGIHPADLCRRRGSCRDRGGNGTDIAGEHYCNQTASRQLVAQQRNHRRLGGSVCGNDSRHHPPCFDQSQALTFHRCPHLPAGKNSRNFNLGSINP